MVSTLGLLKYQMHVSLSLRCQNGRQLMEPAHKYLFHSFIEWTNVILLFGVEHALAVGLATARAAEDDARGQPSIG
jgi:hypothetical protein